MTSNSNDSSRSAKIDDWRRLSSEIIEDFRFFKLRKDISRHPTSGREHRFFIFEFPDWVNIMPLTPEGEVVFVNQFRHGTRELTLEIPGGIVDPGESAREAGLREMFEESGYYAHEAIELGWVHPNPALQENRCWSYLAQNVDLIVDDDHVVGTSSEAIEVTTVPLDEIPGLLNDKLITHALTIAAFDHYWRWSDQVSDHRSP